MDIVVKGRHTAVPDRFRRHAETKLAKLERLDAKVMRVDVELSKEHNPRLSDVSDRVELTVYSRGPVIRAEAAAGDAYAALDKASAKLVERLRRAADRRVRHHANHHANHAATIGAGPAGVRGVAAPRPAATDAESADLADADRAAEDRYGMPDYSPMVVREKVHEAAPMSLDEALSNMELVGHDFYLFLDADSGLPSVVYRRCGYDYGVIRLTPLSAGAGAGPGVETRTPTGISAV